MVHQSISCASAETWGGILSRAHLRVPTCFHVRYATSPLSSALGPASALMMSVFVVDACAASWATQGSFRGCPSSHVPHSRRMFLTLSNGMTLPGLVLSDWNAAEKESPGVIHILTSPQPLLDFFFFFLIPFKFSNDKCGPALSPAPWHLSVLISTTSQEMGTLISILLSHVYSEALSQTLHQTCNWQHQGLCWMTLNVQEKLSPFLEKMYSHSVH